VDSDTDDSTIALTPPPFAPASASVAAAAAVLPLSNARADAARETGGALPRSRA
jgi:hypothetical protein